MSIYLDDELPKNQDEDDFFEKPKNVPDFIPQPAKKKKGCFFFTPLGCVIGLVFSGFSCICLIPIIFLVGCGTFAALFYTNSVSRTGSETLVLENPTTTRLDLREFDLSAINIQGADGDEITINYEVTAYGLRKSDAENLLDNVSVALVRQPDNRITVDIEQTGSFGLSSHDVEFTLIVPPEMAEILLQPTSDVTIENVEANFVIQGSSFAEIRLTNVSGEFDVNTDIGSIIFSGTFRSESNNHFRTDSGDITMTLQEPVSLIYTAQSGTGTEICPDTACTGSYGDRTSRLDVTTDSGDINIRLAQ
jgi:hypothetical protein